MLLSKGKITRELVDMLLSWRHSGFNIFCGPRIQPGDGQAMENLAHYIIRASFSQERMPYIQEESKVIYQSKDGKKEEAFDALEWLAAMCSHIPNKGEQMVRYYGYYSNVKRGRKKNKNQDEWMPCIFEANESSKEYRKNWARLIQKIYEVDPLTCPKCQWKNSPVFMSEFPYLVVPLVLQRIQYSAMIGNILKSKIFQYTDTSLYFSRLKNSIEPR